VENPLPSHVYVRDADGVKAIVLWLLAYVCAHVTVTVKLVGVVTVVQPSTKAPETVYEPPRPYVN